MKVYDRKLRRRAKQAAPAPRPRNAAATRAAILASARSAFARAGYDGVGVREIAKGAGVTAMLVNRYFGSKGELFEEVVAGEMATPRVLEPKFIGSRTPAADIATALVDRTSAAPLDGFLILLHSASSKHAAKIGRQQIESHHHRQVTAAMGGELAAERAAVALSLIAGFQMMRHGFSLSALVKAEPEALKRILEPVLRLLFEGPQPT